MDGREIHVACGVVFRGDFLLAASRPAGRACNGAWEFPGGKLEPGETPARALIRELREELALEVTVFDEMFRLEARTGDGRLLVLHFVRAFAAPESEPVPQEGQEFRWLRRSELESVPWLENDRRFLDFLR